MLRAHRQAWAWQDEYYGLTMENIRALERETQLALAEKMRSTNGGLQDSLSSSSVDIKREEEEVEQDVSVSKPHKPPDLNLSGDGQRETGASDSGSMRRKIWGGTSTRFSGSAASGGSAGTPGSMSNKSFGGAEYRMATILRDSDCSSSDEEFYDAQGKLSYHEWPGSSSA